MTSANGNQKGIKNILQERGLFLIGMKLNYGRKLLSVQPDFFTQFFLLKETVLISLRI